jgi:DNA-directed RNA polymerase subunit RPC12/RpoP
VSKLAQWYCFKCKEKAVEGDVLVTYLDMTYALEGIKCPKCGAAYLLEKTVVEKVAEAEKMLETK